MTEVLNGYPVHNTAKAVKGSLSCDNIYGCTVEAETQTSITDITTLKLVTVLAAAVSE